VDQLKSFETSERCKYAGCVTMLNLAAFLAPIQRKPFAD